MTNIDKLQNVKEIIENMGKCYQIEILKILTDEASVTISENNNYWRRYGFGGLSETAIYDSSWVRLREVTLSYNFPDKWLDKTFIEGLSLSVYGRNLWLNTDYPGVDPETNLTGDSNGIGLDYFNQPNTKSYGLNLNVNF